MNDIPEAGSSPLARGTLRELRDVAVQVRFIPARAGNTSGRRAHCRRRPVHPRSRGEHARIRLAFASMSGSSPLARGTRRDRRRQPGVHRFIPARAGNTHRPQAPPLSGAVHPRSRGEHGAGSLEMNLRTGSSPLARGTLSSASTGPENMRFIPARAGNTTRSRTTSRSRSVHPRSRGEHASFRATSASASGSSPLARGTRRLRGRARTGPRFIPARAGNTGGTRSRGRRRAVHPRSRGEHRRR